MDDGPDAVIAAVAARQHGLLTLHQAREAGFGKHQVERRLATRRWTRRAPAVFQITGSPDTDRSRVMAATLTAGPRALASHRTAAWLHGLVNHVGVPEVVVDSSYRTDCGGLRAHRVRQVDEVDRCRVDHIPTTGIPLTLLHLGAVWPFERVESVTHDALIRKRLTASDLAFLLERMGRRGRDGTASLRAIVRQSVPDARLESELERRLLDLIRVAGLPQPLLQYELATPVGPVRLDFAWPEIRLAPEADGRRWHADAQQVRHDNRRSNAIQAAGWAHLRYGWDAVVGHAAQTSAELLANHRSRERAA
jgi:very-short-patch-repair endonuclease